MDLKEQHILGPEIETHWYYVSKGRALRSLLAGLRVPELLDVGAGSGVFARQFLDAGVCRRAVCVDPNYPEEHTEGAGAREIELRRSVERVTQPLILMIDVLEHVADDGALLRSYVDRAPPGAHVLISVPAFRFPVVRARRLFGPRASLHAGPARGACPPGRPRDRAVPVWLRRALSSGRAHAAL
jgi:2-polyprenyl-3-methyl-5-hydroxy-6-metoxy-1,4-benzoquinol methylase